MDSDFRLAYVPSLYGAFQQSPDLAINPERITNVLKAMLLYSENIEIVSYDLLSMHFLGCMAKKTAKKRPPVTTDYELLDFLEEMWLKSEFVYENKENPLWRAKYKCASPQAVIEDTRVRFRLLIDILQCQKVEGVTVFRMSSDDYDWQTMLGPGEYEEKVERATFSLKMSVATRLFQIITTASASVVSEDDYLQQFALPVESGFQRTAHVGKTAMLSADFVIKLSSLENAEIDEITDIRNELTKYRIRYNAKLSEFAREIKDEPWSEGFVFEADLLYREKVLPALQDIDDALKSDNAIGRFMNALNVSNPGTGTIMTIGLMSLLNSNPAVQAAGTSIAATGAAYNAYKENLKAKQERESNAMFFLHKARERLG